jgi:DNA-binding protein YbaB
MQTVEELMAQVQAQQRRIEDIQRSVERMEIIGYSRNGEATATLTGVGQFTEISIDPRAMRRYDAESIGSLVLEAVNDGLSRLTEASRATFEPIIAESRGRAE